MSAFFRKRRIPFYRLLLFPVIFSDMSVMRGDWASNKAFVILAPFSASF
jgi:hypothetical protein